MSLNSTKRNDDGTYAVVEVTNTVIANDGMLRVWPRVPGPQECEPVADERLTPEQARSLAANLLHAAQLCDGKVVSFHWHHVDCNAHCIADGTCDCPGDFVSAERSHAPMFAVVASGVVTV